LATLTTAMALRARARPLCRRGLSTALGETRFFVRNLSPETTEASVRQAFEMACDVRSVTVPRDAATGLCRGFAYVKIQSAEPEAVRLDVEALQIDGKRVKVEMDIQSVSKESAKDLPKADGQVTPEKAAFIDVNKRLVQMTTASDVLAVFEDLHETFDCMNLATAIHRLGTLSSTAGNSGASLSSSGKRLELLIAKTTSSMIEEGDKWSSRELSNTCWGASKIGGAQNAKLFQAIATCGVSKIETYKAQELANTSWAFAKANVRAPELYAAISNEAPNKLGNFKSYELVNLLWGFATQKVQSPALFDAVAGAWTPELYQDCSAQSLANLVWAYSTAGFKAPILFEAVAVEAGNKLHDFNALGISNLLWAYATAKVSNPALFQVVAAEVVKRTQVGVDGVRLQFNAQKMANIVWAFAKAGVSAPALYDAVAAAPQLENSNAQSISNLCWAYAKQGVPAPSLFDSIALEATKKIALFQPTGLANVAWSFGKAGVGAPELFQAVAVESLKKLGKFRPQEVANLVWAFSQAGMESKPLFEAVALEFPKRLFKQVEISNVLWAYAHAGVPAPTVFKSASEQIKKHKLASFAPNLISTIVWAHATSGNKNAPLLGAIALDVESRLQLFEARDLTKILRGLLDAGIPAPTLFDKAAQRYLKRLPSLRPQDLADLAGVYASSGRAPPALFSAMAAEVPKKLNGFGPRELAELAAAFAASKMENADLFEVLAAATLDKLAAFTARDTGKMVEAFALAAIQAPSMFNAIAVDAIAKIQTFDGPDLARTAWAFSAVDAAGADAQSLFEAIAKEASPAKLAQCAPDQLSGLKSALQRHGAGDAALFAAIAAASAKPRGP